MQDLRAPIGVFFAIIGAALTAMPHARAQLGDAPVNLYTGLSMLVFGGAMIWLARRS